MSVLPRTTIGARLFAGFGVVLALLVVVVAVALSSSGSQRAATTEVADDLVATADALQLKYLSADLNGWQTAYAFDAVRRAPGATEDTGAGSRASFLKVAGQFREQTARLDSRVLSDAERVDLAAASAAFKEFMAVDEEVVALYRV